VTLKAVADSLVRDARNESRSGCAARSRLGRKRRDWVRIEALGFDHAFTYDHLIYGKLAKSPSQAAIPTLTAAALATKTISLGLLVASPNLHHPVPFAHEMITIDRLSGGRLIAGIGSGGRGSDSVATVPTAPSLRGRTERFEEFVDVVAGLLQGDEVTFSGRHYSIGKRG